VDLGPIGLWTFHLDRLPVPRAREVVAELEGLGYGAVWIPEAMGRDPLVHAALLLEGSERIVLATGIASIWNRAARAHMAIYLTLPNYTNNLRRLGFGDDDLDGGGSDRLVDALVAWGDVDAVAQRVRAHHRAGADHVCVQVLGTNADDARRLPLEQWRALAPALGLS